MKIHAILLAAVCTSTVSFGMKKAGMAAGGAAGAAAGYKLGEQIGFPGAGATVGGIVGTISSSALMDWWAKPDPRSIQAEIENLNAIKDETLQKIDGFYDFLQNRHRALENSNSVFARLKGDKNITSSEVDYINRNILPELSFTLKRCKAVLTMLKSPTGPARGLREMYTNYLDAEIGFLNMKLKALQAK